jgi:benzodiazapine receptor
MPVANPIISRESRVKAGIILFGVTSLTAVIGSTGSIQAGSFYAALTQPTWAPPAWLFGPVWTTLYIMMAYSGYRMWRRTLTLTHPALRLFYGQLFLNGLWSWVFFVWHWGALALINILILLLLIARLIQSARHIDDLSAFLLLPYALWVTFAAVLTWALWQLNPVSLAV